MKLALIVKNSLNGDSDEVEKAVRRTLYAMANEMDEQAEAISDAIEALSVEVKGVRRLLIGLTSSVIGGCAIVVGSNILLTL